MILDSHQQKSQLMEQLHMVQISGPYHEALKQVVQTQDLIQAVSVAEIASPKMPTVPASQTSPMVQPAVPTVPVIPTVSAGPVSTMEPTEKKESPPVPSPGKSEAK
jgi:hypothetical protein